MVLILVYKLVIRPFKASADFIRHPVNRQCVGWKISYYIMRLVGQVRRRISLLSVI